MIIDPLAFSAKKYQTQSQFHFFFNVEVLCNSYATVFFGFASFQLVLCLLAFGRTIHTFCGRSTSVCLTCCPVLNKLDLFCTAFTFLYNYLNCFNQFHLKDYKPERVNTLWFPCMSLTSTCALWVPTKSQTWVLFLNSFGQSSIRFPSLYQTPLIYTERWRNIVGVHCKSKEFDDWLLSIRFPGNWFSWPRPLSAKRTSLVTQ